jgi:hypothetical protein
MQSPPQPSPLKACDVNGMRKRSDKTTTTYILFIVNSLLLK